MLNKNRNTYTLIIGKPFCNSKGVPISSEAMSIGQRVRRARQHAGLTQGELAKAVGMKQPTLSELERGLSRSSSYLFQIAKVCAVDVGWLATGKGEMVSGATQAYASPSSNADLIGMEIMEGGEPLRPNEVMLPIFREVEFAAGDGRTQVVENHGAQERFSLPRLERAGVHPSNAALAVARGDSMLPAIHDGATLGIDKGCRQILDGKIYALDHDGMLRIKRLYRLPLNRVRVVSDNSDEYPEEVYSLIDPDAPQIIGRVFWWENFD